MITSLYLEMRVDVVLTQPDLADDFVAAVADELHTLKDNSSRDVAFDRRTSEMTFCFTFDGAIKPQTAMDRALVMGRSAFHAAGGATPDWEQARWSITPEPATSAPPAAAPSPVG